MKYFFWGLDFALLPVLKLTTPFCVSFDPCRPCFHPSLLTRTVLLLVGSTTTAVPQAEPDRPRLLSTTPYHPLRLQRQEVLNHHPSPPSLVPRPQGRVRDGQSYSDCTVHLLEVGGVPFPVSFSTLTVLFVVPVPDTRGSETF